MEAVMEKAPFGENYDLEYEDALQVDGRRNDLEIGLEDSANRSLRAVRYWRSEQERLEKQVKDEVGRLQLWLEIEKRRISDRIGWHEEGLRGFLQRSGKKSLKLAYGCLKWVKARDKVEVEDFDALETWAHHNDGTGIRIKKEADKLAIAKHVKATGEIPDGTDLVTGQDTFSVVTEPQP